LLAVLAATDSESAVRAIGIYPGNSIDDYKGVDAIVSCAAALQ
jgi:hypothetical protein